MKIKVAAFYGPRCTTQTSRVTEEHPVRSINQVGISAERISACCCAEKQVVCEVLAEVSVAFFKESAGSAKYMLAC